METPARYFEKIDNDNVVCTLCPADCKLTSGQYGNCKCRFNKGGELYTDNYAELVSLAVDPIEKKPLYHFHPTKNILSTGANGCNLSCLNCQNWTISQEKVQTIKMSPEELTEAAIKYDSIGVAFTYTEPTIWFEYIIDTAPLLKDAGLKVVLVSNGYINPEPLEELIEYIDAVNVDLKSIKPEFYKKICKGKLQPVLDNISFIAQSKTHLEITNLIIPEYNDSKDDISALVDFVSSVSDTIPMHFSAFHPDYKLNQIPTPLETMLKAQKIAQAKLKYVYLGNMLTDTGSSTYCPNCENLLIKRDGYQTSIIGLKGANCSVCNYKTNIIN